MVQLWEENGQGELTVQQHGDRGTGTGKGALLRSCLCSCG